MDLNICLKMGDLANATQLLMQTRRALAAPQLAGAEIVMLTANVLDALTIDSPHQAKVNIALRLS